MSRLNEMYQGVKRHAGKIVAGAVLVGVLIGMRIFTNNIGEEVYRGNINGREVVYEEGRSSLFFIEEDGIQSIMTVKKDGLTYRLIDWKKETSIDWKNEARPHFKKDKLETVIIADGEDRREYHSFGINKKNLDGKHKREIFISFTLKMYFLL